MKKIYLIALSAIATHGVFGQKNFVRMDEIQGVPMTITYNINPHNDIEGNKYLYEDWKEIRVERTDGLNILIPEGKYDLEADLIILKQEAGLSQLDRVNEVKNFTIEDKVFEGSTYGTSLFSFFEVLFESENVILYKKYDCTVRKGKPSNGITKGTPAKYVRSHSYYTKKVKVNSDALKLKVTNKKILLKTNLYPALTDFLSKYSGPVKTDEDIIKAFSAFNESQKGL